MVGEVVGSRNKRSRIGIAYRAAFIAVSVVVGILQPINRGVFGSDGGPKGFIALIFGGNRRRQHIGNAVAHSVGQKVPTGKNIAVPCGFVDDKRRAVSCIYRFGAVASVHVKFQNVVVAVIVALKNCRAVGRNGLGIVVKLCKALDSVGVACLKLFVGNYCASFGIIQLVKAVILRIEIVVYVLEEVSCGKGHVNWLIIDVNDI